MHGCSIFKEPVPTYLFGVNFTMNQIGSKSTIYKFVFFMKSRSFFSGARSFWSFFLRIFVQVKSANISRNRRRQNRKYRKIKNPIRAMICRVDRDRFKRISFSVCLCPFLLLLADMKRLNFFAWYVCLSVFTFRHEMNIWSSSPASHLRRKENSFFS